MNNFPTKVSLLLLGLVALTLQAHANEAEPTIALAAKATQPAEFTNWPKGKSPIEIGQRVTTRFLEKPYPTVASGKATGTIIYPRVCAWYGALTFTKLGKRYVQNTQLKHAFEPLFTVDAAMVPPSNHVDNSVFGSVPLELYIQTGDKKYLEMGKRIADQQWEAPKPDNVKGNEYFDKGLTKYTRLWIDDMYMITAVQTQAYRATGDRKYIDRAAKEMVFYLDQLQKPNGLFFHAPDVPFYWGRGNGWMAAGMAELLSSLPADNPNRPRIMQGYRTMMDSLLKCQSPDGMWRQLLDDPNSWSETSCTGMFTFAMVTGVKNGWLDAATYAPAARRGWLALVSYINEKGDVSNVCEGTNKKNDRQFYLDRKRITGDFHGQAPILWTASALLR
ncbi:glycosyl hydrolase [bacterium]|nr:MAG: glycosyl hydrolase [bacterium]